MFRRYAALLVLVGYLATQMASLPHWHGVASAEEQKRHDATPHFHCKWFTSADHDHLPRHGHDHRHPGHNHDHDSNFAHEDSSRNDVIHGFVWLHHDDDAVFALGIGPTLSRTTVADEGISIWELAALAHLPDWLCKLPKEVTNSPSWHPPDEVLDGSGTYLTLRNLRI